MTEQVSIVGTVTTNSPEVQIYAVPGGALGTVETAFSPAVVNGKFRFNVPLLGRAYYDVYYVAQNGNALVVMGHASADLTTKKAGDEVHIDLGELAHLSSPCRTSRPEVESNPRAGLRRPFGLGHRGVKQMFKARANVATLAILLIVAAAPASAAAGQLRGRVHESQGGPGISSLTVRLSPAPGAAGRQRATLRRENGQFDLGDVERGDYQLEVLQGDKQVYQTRISVRDGAVNEDIELRLRGEVEVERVARRDRTRRRCVHDLQPRRRRRLAR
jgi:hypothetical protein